ncbi:hypothetical protein [Mammaliicoccus sciuri]|nr:hypothetical protein [Mammaliicoccus sciuri]CAG7912287.1 hypothetical protein SSCS72_00028 [Mammaliicoccus sciuri]
MAKKRTKSNKKNLPLNENETLKAGIAYQKKLQALTDIYGSNNQKK